MKKGKGKRSYESEDEQDDLNKNIKKPKSGEYRDTSEQYESTDDDSEDQEIDDKKTLIFRKPYVISEDINELSKTLHLIEDAKTLDSRLPSEAQ
jgi:TATA-binding protein-associated factor Taf7